MKITPANTDRNDLLRGTGSLEDKKEQTAMEFEKLFARQLVQEMTKGLFKQDDNKGILKSSGGSMYREHIVDTLAGELAKQRELGMADMIEKYWGRKTGNATVTQKQDQIKD